MRRPVDDQFGHRLARRRRVEKAHMASRRSIAPGSGATCAGSIGKGVSLEMAQT